MSNILFPYAHLVGKEFYSPRKHYNTEKNFVEMLVVVSVEKGATDYLQVAKKNDPEHPWSMWAVEVEPLVLLYDLYNSAEALLTDLIDAEEHIHPSGGHVLEDVADIWRDLDKVDAWLDGKQFEPVTDQYGNRVPDDLVTVPHSKKAFEMCDCGLSSQLVMHRMDWYEVKGVSLLLVPLHQVPPDYREFFGTMDDYGFGIDHPSVDYVSESLRRYNEVDGFYHA